MVDSIGWRKIFGVLVPSTNTVVQPEFEAMAPAGVTNHTSRIVIPDMSIASDADFSLLMERVRGALMDSVRSVMSAAPDALIMGMSAETFWDGADGAVTMRKRIEAEAGVSIAMGSEAVVAALASYGGISRIGVVTPYMPVGDERVRRFFAEGGIDVVALRGLRCASPTAIARVTEAELAAAMREVDGPDVQAIVQVGTNLAMARLAGAAEAWLGKPVIAINTATYWHALRSNGINDPVDGFGSLLARH
jgi:maleate isomerase